MRLTLHTDYALRVLIHVAIADGKLITISDIAESFGISKQHLMKVANDLSQKGYLDTVRGRGGGIRLRRLPRDINIGQVVRETEDRLDVIGCLGQRDYCPIEHVCVLRGVLHDALQAFLAVLDGYTLADLIKPQRALASLLLLDRHARLAHNGSPTESLDRLHQRSVRPGRLLRGQTVGNGVAPCHRVASRTTSDNMAGPAKNLHRGFLFGLSCDKPVLGNRRVSLAVILLWSTSMFRAHPARSPPAPGPAASTCP